VTVGGRLEGILRVPSATTVAATNSGGGPTSVSLTAGLYTMTAFCAHLQARLNAVRTPATWTVTLSTGTSGTGKVTIDCVGETWVLTFTSAEVGTVLGFVGNIASTSDAATGTQNARGVWLPDCPLMLDSRPSSAPEVTDLRQSEGPTGTMYALVGCTKYVHTGLRWSHVVEARTHEGAATTTYASFQQWLRDTQFGSGHTWFTPGSAFQVYWDNNGTDTLVGLDLNAGTGPSAGWKLSGLNTFNPKRRDENWNGIWTIEIPKIVTPG
jgi:hypothetical protein